MKCIWNYAIFIVSALRKSALYAKRHAKFINGICSADSSLCVKQFHRASKVILQIEAFFSFFVHADDVSIPVEGLVCSALCIAKVQEVMILFCEIECVADALLGMRWKCSRLSGRSCHVLSGHSCHVLSGRFCHVPSGRF